ncbi:MAG: hypothetical protein GXX91_04715 [Verrucomicrobiaceae bacterium]|nr:hypothetical protein [Verrucomicrobiaceae bacterium]
MLVCSVVFLGGAALRKSLPFPYESVVCIRWESGKATDEPAPSPSQFRASRLNDFSAQIAELRSGNLLSEVVLAGDLVRRWNVDHEAAATRLLARRSEVEGRADEGVILLRTRDRTAAASAELANAIADRFLFRKHAEVRAEANARVVRFDREKRERHRAIEAIEARLLALSADDEAADGGVEGGEDEQNDLRHRLHSERNLLRSLEAKHQLAVIEAGEAKSPARLSERAEEVSATRIIPFFLQMPGMILAGLLAGVGAILVGGRGGVRLQFLADLQERLELPVAGFAPLCGTSLLTEKSLSPYLVESYRDLRTKLKRLPAGDCLFVTLLPLRSEAGVAEAATNLACVLADGGATVLVIDADFRNPQLHPYFEAARHPGLSDFLSGEMRLEETVIKTRRPNLWFMPSGPLHPDPGGLIAGRRMDDLLWDMRSRFDYLLIVAPPLHRVAEAGALAALADGTAVVAPYGSCSVRQLQKARLALEVAAAQLTAVLLTTKAGGNPPASPPSSPSSLPPREVAGRSPSEDAGRSGGSPVQTVTVRKRP